MCIRDRFNPDILILDEATSSVDSETESIIQYAIERLIQKRTSIIIAPVSYTHLRAHETVLDLVCRLLLEKKTHKKKKKRTKNKKKNKQCNSKTSTNVTR